MGGQERGHVGGDAVEKRMGRNPRIGGHKIRNRGKRKRKLRERTEEAGEKEGAPRICNGGRGRGQLCDQKDRARAPVCSANLASISWAGLEWRGQPHQVQQDSAESVRGRSGGIQAVGLQLPKGPERSWVCWRGRTGGS